MARDNEGMSKEEAIEGGEGTREFREEGEGESRQERGVEEWILYDFFLRDNFIQKKFSTLLNKW